jgi:hypothetical protein
MGEDISDNRPSLLGIISDSQQEYKDKAAQDVTGPENPDIDTSPFAAACWKIIGAACTIGVLNGVAVFIYLSWKWAMNK